MSSYVAASGCVDLPAVFGDVRGTPRTLSLFQNSSRLNASRTLVKWKFFFGQMYARGSTPRQGVNARNRQGPKGLVCSLCIAYPGDDNYAPSNYSMRSLRDNLLFPSGA